MARKLVPSLVSISIISALLSACSGGNAPKEAEPKKPAAPEPVKLMLYNTQTLNDEDFQRLFADPVKKKYPHITVEWVKPGKGTNIEDLLAAGTVPDLITTYNGQILDYKKFDLLQDHTPLMKKENMDSGRFEPVIMESIKVISEKGELYAIPYVNQFKALYYNKDIFDKFGVPYPKDGMTWEDAMELAKKLSRTDNGTVYRGLDYDNAHRLSTPFGLDLVDAKTEKAHFNTEEMKRVFELGKQIYNLPGNMPAKPSSGSVDEFFKTKTLAMLATINYLDKAKDAVNTGLKLGVAQYPSFKEKPNIFGMVDAQVIFVPKGSKHQEDAMKVIETLTSDEIQLLSSRATGRNSPLKNPEMKKQFAADMDYLKGIDLQPIFKSGPGPAPAFSKYYGDARKIMEDSFKAYITEGTDVNTVLRLGEEKITQMINTNKSK